MTCFQEQNGQRQVARSNGRLRRWPPFVEGFLTRPWIKFPDLLVYEDAYRALAGDATIPVDRPISQNSGEADHRAALGA